MTEPILTVTQLNQQVRYLLEKSFPSILVEGELSNFSTPTSGHWYFSLKDQGAQVRCAMFRIQNKGVNFTAKEGLHVILKARVALYEERGDFQLIVERMEEAGVGALQKAFELLKNKLQHAGLFDEARKKAIPTLPKQIGIITSSTGAALHDILQVLKQRFPFVPVVIYPTLVQGDQAASNIAEQIKTANFRQECDVLLLARGGGSLEDLWPFNEEIVAYAIAQSAIPIVTGIGHQIDFTIADFVADIRAPTPSAAAAKIVPDRFELAQHIATIDKRLLHHLLRAYERLAQRLDHLTKRLTQLHPARQLEQQTLLLKEIQKKLSTLLQHQLHFYQQRLKGNMAHLHALSPLATLSRGYAIVKKSNGAIIRKYEDAKAQDKVTVQLDVMTLHCTVDTKQKNG